MMTSLLHIPIDGKQWPSLGGQVCDWIESNLCFGPGDLRGQPAIIDDEKRALIWRMYEVYPKRHEMSGRRRFRRCALSLPKGMAKTELAAWIAAAELHPDAPVRTVGWNGAQPIGGGVIDPVIPLIATTEQQSDDLAFGALHMILSHSPAGRKMDIGLERIMRKGGDGKAMSLAGSPNARDGARTTFQVFDESHLFTSDRLRNAHKTMMANLVKRKGADAWALETTTAYEPGTRSVAEATMDYALAVEQGRVKDSALFFFHRQARADNDFSTPRLVREGVIEASGESHKWRDIDGIVKMFDDPTADRQYLRRVYGNQVVRGTSQAFDVIRWKSRVRRKHVVPPGALIVIGFDGSQFEDGTGIVATEVETGYQWLAGGWERPAVVAADAPWEVPVMEVDAAMQALFETYSVWRLYADPPYWQEMVSKWIGLYGEERVIKWWTARRIQMGLALENFKTAIIGGSISHAGDAGVERHIANARRKDIAERDDQGRKLWLIQKERSDSPLKIDYAMASVLSWEARTDALAAGATPESTESVYETEGLMIV